MKGTSKSVLITGVSSGIGLETARLFAADGYHVIGVSRSQSRLRSIGKKLKLAGAAGFEGIAADLADRRALLRAGVRLAGRVRELDALVHSAGAGDRSSLERTGLELWERTQRINADAAFWLTRSLAAALIKAAGSVVFVSSIAGRRRSASLGPQYSASKAALLGLGRHLAAELGPRGVRVNCVAPSQTRTPLLDRAMTRSEQKALAMRVPLRRLAEPSEIASVIRFLCGPGASYVNGACVDLNGGQ